jgi:hypothetical protein
LIRNAQFRRAHLVKSIALTCLLAVLLVGTLQATHIHKEWVAASPAAKSLRPDTGADAQCVFCLTSHAAAALRSQLAVEPVQTSAADTRLEIPAYFPVVDRFTHSIRPPPVA